MNRPRRSVYIVLITTANTPIIMIVIAPHGLGATISPLKTRKMENNQTPTECKLHCRVKGNHKCLKTWQGCILYSMHNSYCPDYQSKEKKYNEENIIN